MNTIEQYEKCIKALKEAENALEYDTNSMYEMRSTIQMLIRAAEQDIAEIKSNLSIN